MKRERPATIDILGLGCTAVDDLVYVPAYPPPDAKIRVQRRERQCGGLTMTALVAASRLGARCAYAGVLGTDSLSQFVIERMQLEGIDTSNIVRRAGAAPVQSTIVVGQQGHTRNIFAHIGPHTGAAPERPSASVIRSVRVLFVDHFGIPGMIRAARIARSAGIPVVGDMEDHDLPGLRELFALVDHLIISEQCARSLSGLNHPARAVRAIWGGGASLRFPRAAVVTTCGADGCYYASVDNPDGVHVPAFKVKAVDTTGCGDVFHGAYAAALAQGWDLPERVRFASAAAALKATRHGGQAGIPSLKKLRAFFRRAKLAVKC